MKSNTHLFVENLHADVYQSLTIDELLYDGKSKYQDIKIFQNKFLGRVLALDDIIQTTEKDEFVYHEMLSHLPIFTHPSPKSVLVIGGGDGGIIEEVLKHNTIDEVVLVEIDEMVIELSQKYLKSICNNAFYDTRLELIIGDGAEYISNTDKRFDIVIVDSPDPVGSAEALFTKEFYENVKNVLKDDGIMARQTGSSFYQIDELVQNYQLTKKIYPETKLFFAGIPTYIGGLFSFVISSKSKLSLNPEEITKRFKESNIETMYYTPEMHLTAFSIPPYILKEIDK
jgi:spermidine synthase